MEIVKILGVHESSFDLDPEAESLILPDKSNLTVGIRSELQLLSMEDVIVLTMDVKYEVPDKTIMKYGIQVLYYVKNWTKETKDFKDEDFRNFPDVVRLIDLTEGTLRGSMMVRADLQNKDFIRGLYLPFISAEKVQKNLVIYRKPSE